MHVRFRELFLGSDVPNDEDAAASGRIADKLKQLAAKNADEVVPTVVNWMSHGIAAAPSGMC